MQSLCERVKVWVEVLIPGVILQYMVCFFNPLPTNDAAMHHGLPIKQQELYGGFNTRRYALLHGFFFWQFLMVGKGLSCFL